MKNFDYKTALIIVVLIFLGAMVLCSCHKEPEGRETYVIHEGKHYSNGVKVYNADNITFRVYIDESWVYEPDAHWNKLIGFSESISPHNNSLRIGWRCSDERIVFGLYAYVDSDPVRIRGERSYKPGTWIEGSVFRSYNTYHVWIGGEHFYTPAVEGKKTLSTLYPYFGGERTAPHNIMFHFRF